MSISIPIGALVSGASASYEQPFEMLTACHERVQRMTALLARLVAHVQAHGVDEQARQAARDVMRYFDQAAPQHHLDEELHVFPPLLHEGEPATVALVHRLQQDHRKMESSWAAARTVLASLANSATHGLDAPRQALLKAFSDLYADHIAAEEDLVYPAVARVLDAHAVQVMAEDMMRRRGIII